MVAPTGAQWEIRHGAHHAVVVEVGGGVREYTLEGEPILEGYPADRMADGGRGLALEPMTCPPNALRSRTDLIVLEPDAAIELAWGVGFGKSLTAI